jgi:deoxyribodipyrimidine photo-lyase
MPPSVLWFRRDLRLVDHPALLAAAGAAEVLPLFVLDPALLRPAGAPRLGYLYQALRGLAPRSAAAWSCGRETPSRS